MCNTDIKAEADKIKRERLTYELEVEFKESQIQTLTDQIYHLRKLIISAKKQENNLKTLKLRK